MTFTKAQYFFTKSRLLEKKRKVFAAYIKRSDGRGRRPGLYNIEELATIWHFPVEANVKAAMIQKAPGRKADAPTALPLAEEDVAPLPDIFKTTKSAAGTAAAVTEASSRPSDLEASDLAVKPAGPPSNLPFI
jgi:hypothetical protein